MKIVKDRIKSLFHVLFMAVAMLTFSSCSNTGQGMQEDYNENTEEVEDEAEDTAEDVEDAADEAGDEIEEAGDEVEDELD